MERVYISTFKTVDEAVDKVDRLHAQGFRSDQIYVLTYNQDRFNAIYGSRVEKTPLPGRKDKANREEDIPEGVEDAVEGEGLPLTHATPITPFAPIPPGANGMHTPVPLGGYVPVTAWADLDLDDETLRAHQRDYKSGDILVVLKTDEGQEYHPNMPANK